MLYGLCSLQTNLLISFHHQSDALLHQGTTFKELLLSSEIRNVMEKSEQWLVCPNELVPYLPTRSLRVHLVGTSDQMSA